MRHLETDIHVNLADLFDRVNYRFGSKTVFSRKFVGAETRIKFLCFWRIKYSQSYMTALPVLAQCGKRSLVRGTDYWFSSSRENCPYPLKQVVSFSVSSVSPLNLKKQPNFPCQGMDNCNANHFLVRQGIYVTSLWHTSYAMHKAQHYV